VARAAGGVYFSSGSEIRAWNWLAAIQGLNQKLDEKNAKLQDLKQSVADLKKLVPSLAEKMRSLGKN
jgi:hypothetical protein